MCHLQPAHVWHDDVPYRIELSYQGTASEVLAARRKTTDGPVRGYRRMLARAQALRTKVGNCVRDLHRKAARFLCANFKAIYIPRFESGRISRSTELSRRIGNGAVRSLMTFSHTEFFNMLKQYALARGVHVIEVGESYTTKTCTFCGFRTTWGAKSPSSARRVANVLIAIMQLEGTSAFGQPCQLREAITVLSSPAPKLEARESLGEGIVIFCFSLDQIYHGPATGRVNGGQGFEDEKKNSL
jgi:Putative transposase DNA-binding domain